MHMNEWMNELWLPHQADLGDPLILNQIGYPRLGTLLCQATNSASYNLSVRLRQVAVQYAGITNQARVVFQGSMADTTSEASRKESWPELEGLDSEVCIVSLHTRHLGAVDNGMILADRLFCTFLYVCQKGNKWGTPQTAPFHAACMNKVEQL